MRKTTVITLVSAALVAGLALGSVGIAYAAPAESEEAPGMGYRMGEVIRDAGARLIDTLADLTGLETDEIAEYRADGQSIADIAESQGVDADTVVDEALADRVAIVDEKVADGTIDAEDADTVLDRMADQLSERVDSTETGPFGQGARGAGGQGMGGGYGGQGAGDQLRDGSCLTD